MTTPKKKKSCKQNMNDNINRKHLEHMSVLFSLYLDISTMPFFPTASVSIFSATLFNMQW